MGNWELIPLKNIIKEFVVPMRDKPKNLVGEIPWCRIEDFDGKYLTNSKSRQGVTASVVREMNLKVYPINTVLVSCSAYLGVCAIVKTPLITNQTFIGLVPGNEIDEEFLFYQMCNSEHELNKLSSGTTISYLSREQFENYKIWFPTDISEQRRVAKILSTWDEAIEQQTKLIELKEKRKKALMQKLLSGEVRFKGFSKKWTQVELKQVGKIVSGGTPSTTEPNYWDGNINWCTPTDITGLEGKVYIGNTVKQITREGLENSSATILPPNSLIVCTRATIGICAINEFEMTTNQGFKSIVPNSEADVVFLYYLISNLKPVLLERANGSTFLEISKSDFESIEILLPEVNEQKKISELLLNIDFEIQSLESTRDRLVKQKQGMMQQLLTGVIITK